VTSVFGSSKKLPEAGVGARCSEAKTKNKSSIKTNCSEERAVASLPSSCSMTTPASAVVLVRHGWQCHPCGVQDHVALPRPTLPINSAARAARCSTLTWRVHHRNKLLAQCTRSVARRKRTPRAVTATWRSRPFKRTPSEDRIARSRCKIKLLEDKAICLFRSPPPASWATNERWPAATSSGPQM
jgi:hypothetical protein